MSDAFTHPIRVSQLNANLPAEIDLSPDEVACAAIAADLGLLALPALRLRARLRAIEGGAWELKGEMTAHVVQPCVITLAPVETRLSEAVHRVYSPHLAAPGGDEVEMGDEDLEPLGNFIDVGAVLVESLALALPEYPRAPDAHLDAPPADEDGSRRPFAGLADMLAKKA